MATPVQEFTPLEHVKDAAAHLDFALDDLKRDGAPKRLILTVSRTLGQVQGLADVIEGSNGL